MEHRLIMENWRGFLLTETMTRSLTTKWRRVIIKLIKHGMRKASDETPIKEAYGIKYTIWTYQLGKDPDSDGWNQGIPPEYSGEEVKGRGTNQCDPRSIGLAPIDIFKLTMNFMPAWAPRTGKDSTEVLVGGSFAGKGNRYRSELDNSDWHTQDHTELNIDIRVDTDIVKTAGDLRKRLSKLQSQLDEVLAHELWHGRQSKTPKDLIIGNDISYYLSPREVEAHARGYYEKSIRSNTTFEKILDDAIAIIKVQAVSCIGAYEEKIQEAEANGQIEEIQKLQQRVEGKKELIRRIPEFKDKVMSYVKKQLPCAEYLDGTPIYPPGCRKTTDLEPTKDNQSWFDRFKNWIKPDGPPSSNGGDFGGGGASDSY